jgi:DNA gyrase subunit B
VSGGLHGVGVSCVNGLSKWLRLTVRRDGLVHFMEFKQGVPQDREIVLRNGFEVSPMKLTGETEKRGTEVHFLPDLEIFSNIDFHYDILSKRLRELSFLNNGVKIRLVDERNNKEDNFAFAGGVKGFVEFINTGKKTLHPNIFHATGDKASDQDTVITSEVAMQWNDGYSEKRPLLHEQHSAARRRDPSDRPARGDDARDQQVHRGQRAREEGQGRGDRRRHARGPVLRALGQGAEPKFSSQTKDKLVSSEVRGPVEDVVSKALTDYLEENPTTRRSSAARSSMRARPARPHARRAR